MEKFKLSHVTLYAKGWYKKSDDIWNDLIEMLKLDDYTPFTKEDAYTILLSNVQKCSFRWCELKEVLIGIYPTECWKYGYYVRGTYIANNKSADTLPDYDMPTAFIYYVLSNLRHLSREEWKTKIPKWNKYPKNPELSIKTLMYHFNKK